MTHSFINHVVRSSAVLALLVVVSNAAFAWPKYDGQILKAQRGVLTSFSNGNKAGGLSIRLKDGTTRDFATFLGTTWNHRRTSCQELPNAAAPCADWSKTIVPLKTSVTVTYWEDVRRDKPGVPGAISVAKDVSVK